MQEEKHIIYVAYVKIYLHHTWKPYEGVTR